MRRPTRTFVCVLVGAMLFAAALWLTAARRSGRPRPSSEVTGAATAEAEVVRAVVPGSSTAWRWLRIRDARRRPVPGVRIAVEGRADAAVATDADGEVAFECTGEAPVAVFFDGEKTRHVELRGPLTDVGVSAFASLDVRVVDGSTGTVLRGIAARLERSGDAEASDLPCLISADRYGHAGLSVHVDPPPRYGAYVGFTWWGPIAVGATRVRLDVPVFPAWDVALRIVDESGAPVAGASAFDARAKAASRGELPLTCRSSGSDRRGLLVLSDVPQIPFSSLTVDVSTSRESDGAIVLFGQYGGLRLDQPWSSLAATVVLSTERRGVVGWGPGVGSWSMGRVTGCGGHGPPPEHAPLTVRAVFRDGRPASGVAVEGRGFSAVTGEDGSVFFERAFAGANYVEAHAHGFLPTRVAAYVDAGGGSEVVVREVAPRAVRVEVVDESGRPLPAACVTSECGSSISRAGTWRHFDCSVAQFERDVELLTPLTGPDGAVTLQEPVGDIRYRVVLGGAEATTESSDDLVRVVLRSPKN